MCTEREQNIKSVDNLERNKNKLPQSCRETMSRITNPWAWSSGPVNRYGYDPIVQLLERDARLEGKPIADIWTVIPKIRKTKAKQRQKLRTRKNAGKSR